MIFSNISMTDAYEHEWLTSLIYPGRSFVGRNSIPTKSAAIRAGHDSTEIIPLTKDSAHVNPDCTVLLKNRRSANYPSNMNRLLPLSRQEQPSLKLVAAVLGSLYRRIMLSLDKPMRLVRAAIVLKPSTLLNFHPTLVRRKYQLLFSPKRRARPGPKGPDVAIGMCGDVLSFSRVCSSKKFCSSFRPQVRKPYVSHC
jgi:hypothetical protein